MKDVNGRRVYGRTRWRRFGLLMLPGIGSVITLMVLVASGVIAVSFQFSGIPFTLGAQNLSGNGFVQYATVDQITSSSAGALVNSKSPGSALSAAGPVADTVTVLHDGTISVLNQTVCVPLPAPPGQNLLVTITAGDTNHGQQAVSFSTLVAD